MFSSDAIFPSYPFSLQLWIYFLKVEDCSGCLLNQNYRYNDKNYH